MPYIKSLSLKGFLEETKCILQTTRKISYKKADIPHPVIEMVLQAAIFKTSAQLEEYIKSSIYDWLHIAKRENCTAGSLPDELKWFFISKAHVGAYKSFINESNESRLFNLLKAKRENHLFDDSYSISNIVTPSSVVGDRKYPSVKNIKSLFYRLGINNVFADVERKTRRQYAPLLKSFLDVRETIAHQNPPDLTYNDIRYHVKNMQGFVSALDRVLFSHVVLCHGVQCWRSS